MSGEWISPRAKAEREKREARDAFELWAEAVERGDMTWDDVRAMQSELGAIAAVATYPASVFQGEAIKKLERSIDGAGNE